MDQAERSHTSALLHGCCFSLKIVNITTTTTTVSCKTSGVKTFNFSVRLNWTVLVFRWLIFLILDDDYASYKQNSCFFEDNWVNVQFYKCRRRHFNTSADVRQTHSIKKNILHPIDSIIVVKPVFPPHSLK